MKQINNTLVIGMMIIPKQECFVLARKFQKEVIHMARKRLTQVFPALLPLRKWQRKKLFYFKMQADENLYSKKISKEILPHKVFETSSLMVNENSGFDMKYQFNKVHNLRLAARTINHIIIEPRETFSFWQLVRWADKNERYRDGLNLVDGEIVGSYGGGLCQLSNMLFWLFLHTPLTIVERYGHDTEFFPATNEELPCGIDATINEGWLDLKVKNDTENTFQIIVDFDDKYMYGRILSHRKLDTKYEVFNSEVTYIREEGKIHQIASVCRSEDNGRNKIVKDLYVNKCEIAHELPENTVINGQL